MGLEVMALGALALGSAYQQNQAQKKAADAQNKAEMEARRIAAQKKPLEETATLTTAATDPTKALGSLNLLVEPGQRQSKGVGLGSLSTSVLGFGG